MALVTPPEWLSSGGRYPAQKDRQVMRDAGLQEGIVDKGDLAVTGGAGFNVNIAAGGAWVQGDAVTRQGLYHVVNDAALTNWAPAGGWPAAHATLPRIDQLVLRVYDSSAPVLDNSDVPAFEVVQGTATSGATLANRTGAAALPNTALRLSDVLIPAAATTIVTANIGNPKAPRAAPLVSVAGAPPQYALGRPWSFVPFVEAYNSNATVSVTNNVAFQVLLNAERWDPDGMHDLVSNTSRFTFQTPGWYQISGACEFAANAVGIRYSGILLNFGQFAVLARGQTSTGGGTGGNAAVDYPFSTNYYAAFGDVVELYVFQDSGGALNATGNSWHSLNFRASWMAP